MDTQRIHNLIEYLEELHEHDRATVEHTTLLLNCYAKLKDTGKLETFIKSGNNFDFDTAITMCRQGGYFDQAVYLARKHGEHDLVVDVLVEDSKNYDGALDYIWRLGAEDAYPNLMRYARVLLEHCPKDATQIFIDYFTGNYRPKKVSEAAPIQAPQSGGIASALPSLSSFIPLAYRQTSAIASPATVGSQQPGLSDNQVAEAEAAQPPPEYEIPKPRTVFSSFVDHPEEFIDFLESCLKMEKIEDNDKVDLYTTLFEMYLDTASRLQGSERIDWEAKAKRLIDSGKVGFSYILLMVANPSPDPHRRLKCSLTVSFI